MHTAKSTVIHFTLTEEGIVLAESQEGVEPTAALLVEAEEACRRVRGDVRRPALWDIRKLEKPKPTAWLGFIENAPKNLTAIAVLGDKEHAGLLGAFPQIINDLLLPLDVFEDYDEAQRWLERFL